MTNKNDYPNPIPEEELYDDYNEEFENALFECEKELNSKSSTDVSVKTEVCKELQTAKKSDFKDFNIIMEDFQSGDPTRIARAKEDACENLKGFIIYMIMRNFWTYCRNNFYDLLQCGFIGVIKGMDVYDPTRTKPTTFFKTYIKSEISRYITEFLNHSTVHYASALNKINRAIRYFEANNIEYNDITLAEYTGISLTSVREALASKEAAISVNFQDELENEPGVSSGVATSMICNPETAVEVAEKESIISNAINSLSPIEREIILDYYGFNGDRLSLREIAENLGITTQQAKVYHQSAISSLYFNSSLDEYANKTVKNNWLFDNLITFPAPETEEEKETEIVYVAIS